MLGRTNTASSPVDFTCEDLPWHLKSAKLTDMVTVITWSGRYKMTWSYTRIFHPNANAITFIAVFSVAVYGEGVFVKQVMKGAHQPRDLTSGASFVGQISVIVPLADKLSDVVPALDSFKIRFVELELTLVHGLYLKPLDYRIGRKEQLQIMGTDVLSRIMLFLSALIALACT
jgi:hypothetical protein